MISVERVNTLASELDRLEIVNIAKRCCSKAFANDMSVVLESWIKNTESLDKSRLLITKGNFRNSLHLYTEIIKALGCFQLDDLIKYIDQYIEHFKSL